MDIVNPKDAKKKPKKNYQPENQKFEMLLVIVRNRTCSAARMQFVRYNFSHLILVHRKCQIQFGNITLKPDILEIQANGNIYNIALPDSAL